LPAGAPESPEGSDCNDEPGLDLFLCGEGEQCRTVQRRLHTGHGLPDEQRLLLPVAPHEDLRADAT